MLKGSCLCGSVKYELRSTPIRTSHCHCKMCQKQHGAAFASYLTLPLNDRKYLSGEELIHEYKSSNNVIRKFCSVCGSNIEWFQQSDPQNTAITLSTLDTEFKPSKINNIYHESAVCWLSKHDFP